MRQYRVIVVDGHRSSMMFMELERAPDLGAELTLPDGQRVEVTHIASSDDPAVDAVVITRSG